MKFKVRNGFVVHHTTTKKVAGEWQETTSTYSEGEEVSFDEAAAKLHAHKLEPIDTDAKKYLGGFVLAATQQPAPAASTAVDQAAIAGAVTQALIAAGVIATPVPAGDKK